jgi:hypothetical protein
MTKREIRRNLRLGYQTDMAYAKCVCAMVDLKLQIRSWKIAMRAIAKSGVRPSLRMRLIEQMHEQMTIDQNLWNQYEALAAWAIKLNAPF